MCWLLLQVDVFAVVEEVFSSFVEVKVPAALQSKNTLLQVIVLLSKYYSQSTEATAANCTQMIKTEM